MNHKEGNQPMKMKFGINSERHSYENLFHHPRENGDPGFKPFVKKMFPAWIPAFAGMTIMILLAGPLCAVPNTMRFQGRLTDSLGRPITGTPQVRYEIYDALTNGTRVWGPSSYLSVNTNEAGLFSVDIDMGMNSGAVFSNGSDLYLQVIVKSGTGGQDQILSPRQHLSNVPYAFYSQVASSATVAGTANAVSDNSISTLKVIDGAITTSKVAAHAIDPINLSIAVTSQLTPSGMIAMFSDQCPPGWSLFSGLAGRFPLGAKGVLNMPLDSFSDISSHQHTMNHTHTMNHAHSIDHHHSYSGTTDPETPESGGVNSGAGNNDGSRRPHKHNYAGFTDDATGIADNKTVNSGPPSLSQTGSASTVETGMANHIPPYYAVLFCQKD
jgi:hypothetical protein